MGLAFINLLDAFFVWYVAILHFGNIHMMNNLNVTLTEKSQTFSLISIIKRYVSLMLTIKASYVN